jgi:hypothetical protein
MSIYIRAEHEQEDLLADLIKKITWITYQFVYGSKQPFIETLSQFFGKEINQNFLDTDNLIIERGIVILESDPQTRIMLDNGSPRKISFSYLIQVIQYIKYNDKYLYMGVFNRGLSIYESNKSLESLNDPVSLSPVANDSYGLICLPHHADFVVFDTKKELIHYVLNLWWGTSFDDEDFYATSTILDFISKHTSLTNVTDSIFPPENYTLIKKPL